MSSSTSFVYPHLPPTTNILNSQQRTRLMRSTRKLGAVLGTTPYLLENDTSFTLLPLGKTTSRALKRQGSIFTHHQQPSSLSLASVSSSTSSSHHPSSSASSIALPRSVALGADTLPLNPPGLSTTRNRRAGDKRHQLYLQLNPVQVPPPDDRTASLLSPTSCTFLPPTPTTPTPPDPTELRRKRMAKLARHLGENIPIELVLSPKPTPKPPTEPQRRLSRRRARSVHVTRTEAADVKAHGQSKEEWVGEWNRSNIRDVQKELRNLKLN